MLLRNQQAMRADIDMSVSKMKVLTKKINAVNMIISACLAACTISVLAALFIDSSKWHVSNSLIIGSIFLYFCSVFVRQRFKNQHSEISKYTEYLLSDPNIRSYYSELPIFEKNKTGFTPKPGTRLKR